MRELCFYTVENEGVELQLVQNDLVLSSLTNDELMGYTRKGQIDFDDEKHYKETIWKETSNC